MKKIISKLLILILAVMLISIAFVSCSAGVKYTISFKIPEKEGNWDNYFSARVSSGEIIQMPDDPKKEGYLFYGWYLDENYNNEFKSNAIIEENIEVFAKFVKAGDYPTTVTIIFNTNGGTAIPAMVVDFGKIINRSEEPKKEGYVFCGWYLDKEYTKCFDKDNDRVRGNLELYAKWDIANYNVEYVLNGGKCEEELQTTFSIENPLVLPDTSSFVKVGYAFEGIYTDKELESPFDISQVFDTDLKLYVKWNAMEYHINYNMPEDIVIDGKIEYTFTYGSSITMPNVSMFGYVFKGWFLTEDYSQKLIANSLPANDIEVYPLFEEKILKITYYLNGGTNNTYNKSTFNYFATEVEVFAPRKKGYNFGGWYIDSDFNTPFDGENKNANIVLYAKWNPITYNVTYHIPNNVQMEEGPSSFNFDTGLSIPIPQKEGYDFRGWYLESTLNNRLDVHSLPTKNIDLYPKFELKRFKITYLNLNNGTNNSSNVNSYGYFDSNIVLYNPKRVGYTFDGWYLDDEFNTPFDGVNTKAPITVYAKWTPIEYTITYHYENDVIFDNEGHNTYNIESDFNFSIPDKFGYYFVGWFLEEYYDTLVTNISGHMGNLDLYACFMEMESLDRENLVVCEHVGSMTISLTETKNLCILLNHACGIKKTNLPSTSYVYVNKTAPVAIVKNSYIMSFELYDINYIHFEFNDGATYGVYITLVEQVAYNIDIPDYCKNDDNDFVMTSSDILLPSRIKDVSIDGYSVPYNVDSNTIVISQDVLDVYTAGRHEISISTDRGNKQERFYITNNTKANPYNVNIDVESYPNIYVRWDCDLEVEKYIVSIDGVRYDSINDASLFDNKMFDATGLLTTQDQEVIVIGLFEDIEYSSSVVLMPLTITNSNIEQYLSTSDGYGYEFLGVKRNFYITNYFELQDVILYAFLRNSELSVETYNVYDSKTSSVVEKEYHTINILIGFNEEDIEDKLDYNLRYYNNVEAVDRILTNRRYVSAIIQNVVLDIPEAFAYSLVTKPKSDSELMLDKIYAIGVQIIKDQEITEHRTIDDAKIDDCLEHDNMLTHYGKGLPDSYVFPYEINSKGDAPIYTSIEYYMALENGYKPIPMIPKMAQMEDMIKQILKEILDESMNEYQIALAIYEYLAKNVYYDYSLADFSSTLENPSDVYGFSSFYIEGLFFHKVGVCNGIAGAYSTMLNMMGIKAIKLIGEYEIPGNPSSRVGHAWVKLRIGGNWYLSDPTWASIKLQPAKLETISYQYFLMDEVTSYNTGHVYTNATRFDDCYAGENNINYYTLMKFTQDDIEYDYYMNDITEYDALIQYAISNSNLESGERQVLQIYSNFNISSSNIYGYKIDVHYSTDAVNYKYVVIEKN